MIYNSFGMFVTLFICFTWIHWMHECLWCTKKIRVSDTKRI